MDMKELLNYQYEVLNHEGKGLTEIRVFEPKVQTFFCKGKEEFIKTAMSLSGFDTYVGVQPRTREAGDISSIDTLNTIVFDVDPVRPKDTASTDEQHKAAIELANRITKDIGGGLVVSSGSGAHAYVPITPIKVENREELTNSLREFNQKIKAKYATKELKIDNIFDLPRVIRLLGSNNSRSDRQCVPIGPMGPIPRLTLSFNQTPKTATKPTEIYTDELTQRFQRLCRTNKRLKELSEGSVAFESASEADMAFVATLCTAQFTINEVKALWEYNARGNKEPKKGDVERIFDKVFESKDAKAYNLTNNSSAYFSNLAYRRMGIRTGFNALDEKISGLKDGKIYIMAARPGTGKTTIAMQILTNIAEQGIPCLMFPTEVGAEPLIDKILSRKCEISLTKFQNGTFTKEDVSKIEEMKDYVSSLPLTIYDDFGLGIDAYETQIDKYAPKVVCLDYFQSLKFTDPNSVGEKEDAVRRIKKLTKDRNIVTICMSQLNRNNTGKAGMAELKGTGALEEFADVICQMYRGEGHNYPVPIDMIVTKSKYSSTGPISLLFSTTIAKLEENPILNEKMH